MQGPMLELEVFGNLMPATAKMHGLQINSVVDERFDPYKSTEAAVSILADLL